MSSTDIAAWWGAVVATVVLAWDAVKWFISGPRLRVSAQGPIGYPDGRVIATHQDDSGLARTELAEYCHVEIVNIGDRPTTIIDIAATHKVARGAMQVFSSVARFRMHFECTLPAVLGPGELWSARIEMDDVLRLAERGTPVLQVRASHREKPVETPFKLAVQVK